MKNRKIELNMGIDYRVGYRIEYRIESRIGYIEYRIEYNIEHSIVQRIEYVIECIIQHSIQFRTKYIEHDSKTFIMDLEGIVTGCASFGWSETDLGEPRYGNYEQIAHQLPVRSHLGGMVKKGARLPAPQKSNNFLRCEIERGLWFQHKMQPNIVI